MMLFIKGGKGDSGLYLLHSIMRRQKGWIDFEFSTDCILA